MAAAKRSAGADENTNRMQLFLHILNIHTLLNIQWRRVGAVGRKFKRRNTCPQVLVNSVSG
jgi:hypothetical protein